MISVHQMGEVLGKVSGCSCTQLEEYSSEAGVSFRKCCIRMSSKTGSQPMTVTRIFFEEKCTSKRGLAVFIQNCNGTI